MRTLKIDNVGEITYPEELVYLGDENFFVFKGDVTGIDDPEDVFNSVTLELVWLSEPEERIILRNDTTGPENVIDMTYALMSLWGKHDEYDVQEIVVNYDVSYTAGGDGQITFKTQPGYTLPNRQHFSDTFAYVPPMTIFKKKTPSANRRYVTFGTNNDIVVDGMIQKKNLPFRVYNDGCDKDTKIDIPFSHGAWPKETGYNGITHIILDRVVFNSDFLGDLQIAGKISQNAIPLEHGMPSVNTDQAIISLVLEPTALDSGEYKVVWLQEWYNGLRYVASVVNDLKIRFEYDLTKMDFHSTTSPMEYPFEMSIGDFVGDFDPNGRLMFCSTLAGNATSNPYEAIRFMFNCKLTNITQLTVPLSITNGYDYSGIWTDRDGNKEEYEMKCLKYGVHYVTSGFGVDDPENLMFLPYSGVDGVCIMADKEYIYVNYRDGVYNQSFSKNVPQIAMYQWFNIGTFTSRFRRWNIQSSTTTTALQFDTVKRTNLATTEPSTAYGVHCLELKNFCLFDNNSEKLMPQGVKATLTGGKVLVYDYPLRKFDTDTYTDRACDLDGNFVPSEIRVNILCEIDLFALSADEVIGSADVIYTADQQTIIGTGLNVIQPLSRFYIDPVEQLPRDGRIVYQCLPFVCGENVWKDTPETGNVWMKREMMALYTDKLHLNLHTAYVVDFYLGQERIENDAIIIPQPVIPQYVQVGTPFSSGGVEINTIPDLDVRLKQTPICTNINLSSEQLFVVTNPCVAEDYTPFNLTLTSKSVYSYKLQERVDCGDNLLWICYTNMDGLTRWCPVQVLSTTYKNSGVKYNAYDYYNSPIRAFLKKNITSIEESVEVVATNIPREAFIEDMFNSNDITVYNSDASVFFPATIDEDEVTVTDRQVDADYRFKLIKKV